MLQPSALLLSHYWKAELEQRRQRTASSYGREGDPLGPRRRRPAFPGLRLRRRTRLAAAA